MSTKEQSNKNTNLPPSLHHTLPLSPTHSPKQPPRHRHIAFCILGQLRAARIGTAGLLEWLQQLAAASYKVHLFLGVSRDTTIVDWKRGEELRFLQDMYTHPKVVMDETEWVKWVNALRQSVYSLEEIDENIIDLPLQTFPHPYKNVHHRILYKKVQMMGVLLNKSPIPIQFDACIITRPDMFYTSENICNLVKCVNEITALTSPSSAPPFAYQWDMLHILSPPLISRLHAALPHISTPDRYQATLQQYIHQLQQPHANIATHTFLHRFLGEDANCIRDEFNIQCLCRFNPPVVRLFEEYLAA